MAIVAVFGIFGVSFENGDKKLVPVKYAILVSFLGNDLWGIV